MNQLFNLGYFVVLAYYNWHFLAQILQTKELMGNCYAKDDSVVPFFDDIKWPDGML